MTKSDDAEIVCAVGDGRQVELSAPVLGTICTRCESRLDDVCFLIRDHGDLVGSGGLCGACLAGVLEPHVHR